MQTRRIPFSLMGWMLCLSLALLPGCSDFFAPKHKPKHAAVSAKPVQAEKFALNLALADLALKKDPGNVAAAAPYVKVLNSSVSAKTPQDMQIAMVVFEYAEPKQAEREKLAVPVPLSDEQPKFSELKQAMKSFLGVNHVLHNLRAYTVTVTPSLQAKLSKDDATLLAQQLQGEQQRILATAQELSPYENARLQLQLTRFFLEARTKDAAYLALENAKDALAFLAEKERGTDITALSEIAGALEIRLHKEMPYKL